MRCRTGARSKWKRDTTIYENTLAERSNGGGGGVCGYAYVCVCRGMGKGLERSIVRAGFEFRSPHSVSSFLFF